MELVEVASSVGVPRDMFGAPTSVASPCRVATRDTFGQGHPSRHLAFAGARGGKTAGITARSTQKRVHEDDGVLVNTRSRA